MTMHVIAGSLLEVNLVAYVHGTCIVLEKYIVNHKKRDILFSIITLDNLDRHVFYGSLCNNN